MSGRGIRGIREDKSELELEVASIIDHLEVATYKLRKLLLKISKMRLRGEL